MKQLLTPIIYMAFGAIITTASFYVYSLNDEPTTQINNEFRKIKNKKGNTDLDISNEVKEEPTKRRRLFNRNK